MQRRRVELLGNVEPEARVAVDRAHRGFPELCRRRQRDSCVRVAQHGRVDARGGGDRVGIESAVGKCGVNQQHDAAQPGVLHGRSPEGRVPTF